MASDYNTIMASYIAVRLRFKLLSLVFKTNQRQTPSYLLDSLSYNLYVLNLLYSSNISYALLSSL